MWRRSGFTLLELVMAMSIILILGGSAAVVYSRNVNQSYVESGAENLAANLRKAQIYAMTGKGGKNWGVYYSGGVVTLYRGPSYAARDAGVSEAFSLGPGVTISGLTEVNFARGSGIPSTALTVNFSGSGSTRNVTLNAQGGVSL